MALSGRWASWSPAARSSAARCCCVDGRRPAPGPPPSRFELAAAVTAVGEWAAAVDLDGTLGALAAREAGVALDRFAVVRRVPPARWATVVAALLDGVSLVIAEVPRGVGAATRAGWWRAPANGRRSSWSPPRGALAGRRPRSRCTPRAARGSGSTTPGFLGGRTLHVQRRRAGRGAARAVGVLARAG